MNQSGQWGLDGVLLLEGLAETVVGPVKSQLERPLSEKLLHTKALIAKNIGIYRGKAVVSCSFGKDSMIVLNEARHLLKDIPVVFNNTGVEYPETIRFAKEVAKNWDLNLIVTEPVESYWKCVKNNGFAKGSKNESAGKQCCYRLKERPMELAIREYGWQAVFDGTTAAESRQRALRAVSHGDCFHHIDWNIQKVKPILWWTEADVWAYTKEMGIPVNPLYYAGSKRVGCMTCTAYKRWEVEMSLLTPKLYRLITSRMEQYERQMALFGWVPPSTEQGELI